MRKCSPLDQRHERLGNGLQPIEEGLQGPCTTDGRAKQPREKVQHRTVSEPLPHQVHLSTERREEAMAASLASDEDTFSKPGRNRRLRSRSGVDVHTRMGYGAHDDLQERHAQTCSLSLEVDCSALLQAFFSFLIRPGTSLRIPWEEPHFQRAGGLL